MKIEVKKLTKNFKNTLAVNNISFEVNSGQTIGLLGPNGCGKTTSIGMILGLIKPTSGQVLIDNKDINKTDRCEVLSKINFASPYIELPKKLTVKQNLEVYARLYGIEDFNSRIEEISEDLNLEPFINRKNGELSSGQKNRVSLAKSLINKPKILLLDEPTASLDPDTGDYIRSYLEKYKSENNISILLASHNMDEVMRLSDNVLMMKEGQIIDQGTSQDLINKHGRENLEQVFLKLVREKNEY